MWKIKPEPPKRETKDLQSIVSDYNKQLKSLQSSVEREIRSITRQVQAEINAGTPLGTIYTDYQPLGNALESSTDSAVSSIISSMETELRENGYDTSSASALYDEYLNKKSDYLVNITLP